MPTPDLNPCPACKGDNIVIEHLGQGGKVHVFGKCLDCGFSAPAVEMPDNPANFSRRELVAARVWNYGAARGGKP